MASRRLIIAALLLPGAGAARAGLPITHGDLDTADPAVVGVVASGHVGCSGTLVAPRVVLTAAHCLSSTTVTTVLFGPDLDTGRQLPVLYTLVHPDFDVTTLRADVGLILLGEASDVPPVPLLETAPPALAEVRVVGFGQTSATDGGAARKRAGTATIAAVGAGDLTLQPGPSLTCGGDSGGPALLLVDGTPFLAGVTSAGDASCATSTRSLRVDAIRSFVTDFVARTADASAAAGERCFDDAGCAAGRCFFPDDAPAIGYCSPACTRDGDCAAGMACDAGACRHPEPSPGALGSDCASYTDCDSLLCSGAGTCSVVCTAAAASCPAGFSCLADSADPTLPVCLPDAPAAGCALAAPPSDGGVLFLLVILLALRRRRGPSAPCAASGTRTCSSG